MGHDPSTRPGRLSYLAPSRLRLMLTRAGTQELVRWSFYCLAIGIVAGIGATVFTYALFYADVYLLGGIAHVHPPQPGGEPPLPIVSPGPVRQWAVLLLPAIGGLLTGLLVFTVAPEAEGHGTDAVIDAFHNRQGRIRPAVPIVKIIASALTIGTGGSAGREGPIAQVGAGFGSLLGRALRLPPAQVRQLVIIGAAAGIGAVFRAPLGGALFAASVLYRETDYEHLTLMPGIMASVVSLAVYSLLGGTGFEPIFRIDKDLQFQLGQLPLYFVMGILLIPLSMLYIWVFYGLRDLFKKVPLPRHIVPMIGGLGVGAIALWYPQILGDSYGYLQQAMDGELPIRLMITIALLKILATSLTIGSGGSGGVFAPSLVIGGLAGAAMGAALHMYDPVWFPDPEAFAVVGMAAFFTAASKTPIASLVLILEMSGGYMLLIPGMLAIATAYMFGRTDWTIYEKQVLNRFASPAHRGSYVVDILENIPVLNVLRTDGRVATVEPETSLEDLYNLIGRTRQSLFPVVEDGDRYVGSVPLELLQDAPHDPEAAYLIIAEDLMEQGTRVRPGDNLNVALEILQRTGLDELPVVDEDGWFKGLISRRDVLAAYYRQLKEIRGLQ